MSSTTTARPSGTRSSRSSSTSRSRPPIGGRCREGLPVGLQIVGRHLADADVLRAAAAYERAAPWAHHRPDVAR